MIDSYLINKYYKKEEFKQNRKISKCKLLVNMFIMIISIALYLKCNKNISLELIPSIFFPYFYTVYRLINFSSCLNKEKPTEYATGNPT